MQELKLRIKGLHTHASDLASVPDGALSRADDIVVDKEDTAEPRRGYNRSYAAFSDSAFRANKMFVYQDYLFSQYSTDLLAYYSTILDSASANFTGTGAWTAVSGAYAPPTDAKVHTAEANQNLYMTTSTGVVKLDAYNATPVMAGAPKGLDVQASIVSVTGNWLTTAKYVAYRVVWGYRDANNNLILGAPSQRELIQNTTAATASVRLRLTIPATVTTAFFYQVYRSAAETSEPNDELQLVYEANPTSTDITNKYVEFDDITPDELRGATIYTAATQQGLVNGNEQAPLCKDIGVYKNHMFFGNTTSKHRKNLTLLATGGSNGLVVNDVITIGGISYVGKSAELATSAQFRVHTSGTFTFLDADVNAGTETITEAAHGLSDGDAVTFTNSGGALPVGISTATTYYIINSTTNTFQLSASFGGSVLAITSAAGGGTHTLSYGGSSSQNIRNTALSLIRVINRFTDSTVTAYYLSNPDDLPGLILLEEESIGGSAFYVGSSRTSCWSPSTVPAAKTVTSVDTGTDFITSTAHGLNNGDMITFSRISAGAFPSGIAANTVYYIVNKTTDTFQISLTSGGAAINIGAGYGATVHFNLNSEESRNDRFKNAVFFSKSAQPEAVPLPNFAFAGSADKEILRIIPLRDSLFILKEDGIYRLSGEDSSSFRIDLFDSTTRLLAPESAAVLNNQIYCLTDQGVVAISEGGVQVRSRPIESTLLSLIGINPSVLRTESFGISYETERKYILFVPTVAGDTVPTQAFVFNTFTNTWTRWVLTKTCGVVHSTDDKLYLGDGLSAYVNQERKSLSYRDYVDYGFAATITAVNGTTITMSGTDDISVGDIIFQSATVYSIVESVDTIAGTATVSFDPTFVTGATDVLTAIPSRIAWVPITLGNPGILKQFREVTLLFKTDFTGSAELVFTSDTSPSSESETVDGTDIGLWGLFGWGEVAFGGTNNRRPIRLWIPRNMQRSTQLTVEFQHSTGYAKYQLNGISITANSGSERVAV